MKIVIFGLSITSSWGNGHATTYRSLCRALAQRGHRIVFFERDAEWYANNRDIPGPEYCHVVNYSDWQEVRPRVWAELAECDVAIIGSYFPNAREAMRELADSSVAVKAFYDIDTPVTLSRLRETGETPYLRATDIPAFDIYFSFTGGPALRELEDYFHARRAVALFCSVDPDKHAPQLAYADFACAMSYMGTYAPDRQPKLDELLCSAARELRDQKFIVAGPQYPADIAWPRNVLHIDHLEPKYHSRLYSSSRLVLNVTRRDMVMAGYSPSVRLFEAAACGAPIVSDVWPGLSGFFLPGEEILTASAATDVKHYLSGYSQQELSRIGLAARERVLAEHSSMRRAEQFENHVSSISCSSLQAAGD